MHTTCGHYFRMKKTFDWIFQRDEKCGENFGVSAPLGKTCAQACLCASCFFLYILRSSIFSQQKKMQVQKSHLHSRVYLCCIVTDGTFCSELTIIEISVIDVGTFYTSASYVSAIRC